MEPTIYKPSIYKGAGIYKAGAEGGGSILKKQIYGQPNFYMVDSNGYIGYVISSGDSIACLVDTSADYSGRGLGQVKFYNKQTRTIQIHGLDFETTIINGIEWLAQNFDVYIDEMGVNAVWPYNDENLYGRNGKNYGMLYNLAGVDVVRNNINDWAPGWRIPSQNDYNKLIQDCGRTFAGKYLADNVGGFAGFGENKFAFNARPAGFNAGYWGGVENRVVYPVYNGSLEYFIIVNYNDMRIDNGYTNNNWYCSLRLCRDN